jgi:hypothetical protein
MCLSWINGFSLQKSDDYLPWREANLAVKGRVLGRFRCRDGCYVKTSLEWKEQPAVICLVLVSYRTSRLIAHRGEKQVPHRGTSLGSWGRLCWIGCLIRLGLA